MKPYRSIVMLLIFAIALASSAVAMPRSETTNGIPGLAASDLELLSGIWEQMNVKEDQAKMEPWKSEAVFSWGSGRYTPSFSVIIDLGAQPPYIQIPGLAWVRTDRAKKTGPSHFVFWTTTLAKGADDVKRLEISLNLDETISFTGTIGQMKINSDEWRYFRTYGPGQN